MKSKTLILALASLSIPAMALAKGECKKGKGSEDHRARILEKFDTDGDGELSDTEKEAMKTAMKEHREELLAKYDSDGDGELDKEERKAAKDAGEKLPPHGKKGPRGKKDKETESL